MSSVSPTAPFLGSLSNTKQLASQSIAPTAQKESSDFGRRQHPVDTRLDRLIRDVLPSAPYLLRLRSRSSQYHGRDRYYWRKDTHFDEDEEELQYLTFRPLHDGTFLYAQGQWDDGNGSIAPKDLSSSRTSNGHTPFRGQTATKKITLADYAKMDKSKSKTPHTNDSGGAQTNEKTITDKTEVGNGMTGKSHDGSKHHVLENSVSKVDAGKEHAAYPNNKGSINAMPNHDDTAVVARGSSAAPVQKSAPSNELAQHDNVPDKLEQFLGSGNPKPSSAENSKLEESVNQISEKQSLKSTPQNDIAVLAPPPTTAPSSASAPAPEATPEKAPAPAPAPVTEAATEVAPETGKAAMTSLADSTEEMAKSTDTLLHGLPPMLSPTLPPEIEEELAKRTPRLRGGLGTSSRVPSISPQRHNKDHKRDTSSEPKAKSSDHNSNTSVLKPGSQDPKQITSAPRQQSDETSHSAAKSVAPKKSLLVKLQIRKKSNRRILAQYLRMKPTPHRGSQKSISKSGAADIQSDSNSSKISSHLQSSGSKNSSKNDDSSGTDEPLAARKSRKRPAADNDDDEFEKGNAKRGKGPGQDRSSKKSSSSQRPASSLPESKATAGSAPQSLPNSAQKSHLNIMSTSMQRTASQESAATPARDITPTANGHKPDSPERREWKKEVRFEVNRLLRLAREIKHDSDVYLKHLKGSEYDGKRQLGSVIATEATLCFMLAAIVSDEPGRSAKTYSNTELWTSTRDFISSLSSNHANRFQYLYGFLKQLEGLVCDTLTYQHDMRGDAILREYNRVKTQEAVSTPANADSYIAENWSFLKEAQETRFRARTAWREGQLSLYDNVLEKDFPQTWSRRRHFAGRGKGRDPVALNDYAKEGYALPLGINSTALDAVNFGLSFLTELCGKEGMEWKSKLVLRAAKSTISDRA